MTNKNLRYLAWVVFVGVFSGVIGWWVVHGLATASDDRNTVEVVQDDVGVSVDVQEEVLVELPENLLPWLPENVRRIAQGVEIMPSEDDYLILSSLLSNDKKEVVYIEIHKCLAASKTVDWLFYEGGHNECADVPWYNYRIFIKDLETGEIRLMYTYKNPWAVNWWGRIISAAHAGAAATFFDLPIGWSPQDNFIILVKDMISSAPSEGWTMDIVSKMDVKTGTITGLSQSKFILSSDFGQIIYGDAQGSRQCETLSFKSAQRVVLEDIETGRSTVLWNDKWRIVTYPELEVVRKTLLIYTAELERRPDNQRKEVCYSVKESGDDITVVSHSLPKGFVPLSLER